MGVDNTVGGVNTIADPSMLLGRVQSQVIGSGGAQAGQELQSMLPP